jgi:tellurite resistance protein TerC
MADRFRYLNSGLGVILGFVGIKMILATADVAHLSTTLSLGVIVVVLAVAVGASLRAERRAGAGGTGPIEEAVQRSHEEGTGP